MKKIKCVKQLEGSYITVGKIYSVIEEPKGSYNIYNDRGCLQSFDKSLFGKLNANDKLDIWLNNL